MVLNDRIGYSLKLVERGETFNIDGLSFSGVAFIQLSINKENLDELEFFNNSIVVFKELLKSSEQSGDYLIFTGLNGIADEAGWDYIEVLHIGDKIVWKISRDEIILSFQFGRIQYTEFITDLIKAIDELPRYIVLEPSLIIYPE